MSTNADDYRIIQGSSAEPSRLSWMIREQRQACDAPLRERPMIPPERTAWDPWDKTPIEDGAKCTSDRFVRYLRLRKALRIIAHRFMQLLTDCNRDCYDDAMMTYIYSHIDTLLNPISDDSDIPKIALDLAELDRSIENMRQELGIDGSYIEEMVHNKIMSDNPSNGVERINNLYETDDLLVKIAVDLKRQGLKEG